MIGSDLLRNARILIVDDEPPNVLLLERILAKGGCENVHGTTNPAEVTELVSSVGPDLILLDLHMPRVNGFEVLKRLEPQLRSTFLPVLVLTADTTVETRMRALSSGAKDFLTKPINTVEVLLRIGNLLETKFLYQQEHILLDQTLRGSIQALTDILAMVSPAAFSRAIRGRDVVSRLLRHLKMQPSWELEVAALLSQLGSVTLPDVLVQKLYLGKKLTHAESVAAAGIPQASLKVIENLPRLENVTELLRYQMLRYDGRGSKQDNPTGNEIPWGARVLKLVLDMDVLESRGLPAHLVLERVRQRSGWYDPALVEAFTAMHEVELQKRPVLEIPLSELRPGMVLAEDLRTTADLLFVARGHEVSFRLVERLRHSASLFHRNQQIHVVRGTIDDVKPPQRAFEVAVEA